MDKCSGQTGQGDKVEKKVQANKGGPGIGEKKTVDFFDQR
jgi:hypothetical protein